MKVLTTIGFVLLMSMTGFAQIPGFPQGPGIPSLRGGDSVVDNAGNLVVIDLGRSPTGVTVTGLQHSFYPPQTRVTVLRPGSTGNVQTVTYDNAALQVIGVGTSAVYAIVTVYTPSGTTVSSTESLIAIKAGQPLPMAISGFPSFPLPARTQTKGDSSDYISLVTQTAATSTTPATRTASVVHFNGTSFDMVSSGMLP
jgi:hypothetical protein